MERIEFNVQTKEKKVIQLTAEEIAAAQEQAKIAEREAEKQNALDELENIDRKSIRALREGNADRLKELEDKATKLREKLKG